MPLSIKKESVNKSGQKVYIIKRYPDSSKKIYLTKDRPFESELQHPQEADQRDA